MKTFSYIALSLTLALAFCLWLPNNLSFTILWMGTAFLSLPLLIADVIALIYLIRHRKENCVKGLDDLRELIQYAESLTDSVSVSFPSDSIPKEVSREQYEHVLQLLKKARCESIKTYSGVFTDNSMVVFRHTGFTSNGYLFFPGNEIKVFRWDPLGSDFNGIYDIDTPPFKCSIELPR